jgi:hypothetical protein
MKHKFKYLSVFAAIIFALTLSACEREGPAERAGEAVDDAVEEAGDALEEAGDAVEEATD